MLEPSAVPRLCRCRGDRQGMDSWILLNYGGAMAFVAKIWCDAADNRVAVLAIF